MLHVQAIERKPQGTIVPPPINLVSRAADPSADDYPMGGEWT